MSESAFSSLIESGREMYSRIVPHRLRYGHDIPVSEAVHVLHLKTWAAESQGAIALAFGEKSREMARWQQIGWEGPPAFGHIPIISQSNSAIAIRLLEASTSLLLEFRVYAEKQRPAIPQRQAVSPEVGDGRVFIIHGHDIANALRLKGDLRNRFGLEPVILSDQPAQGRTIIEKFEEEAGACSFAFALLTPDDQVQTLTGEHTQARPNVVFELGWFYAKLGRERVIILSRRGTRIHSDLAGIETYEFVEDVREQMFRIHDELTKAGLIGRRSDIH